MPTLDSAPTPLAGKTTTATGLIFAGMVLVAALALTSLFLAGCTKNPAMAAIETDAHGYMCLKCGAKVYTEKKVFLESKCPKCQQESLVDVIGYWCEKDQHLTIRPQVAGPNGASICEKCGVHLKNAMVSPREKDLLAWGATKTVPK
jgi:DNA-directed RNA polymerase subunit RPC12/RpoP